jgi:hypothetical protein
MHGYVTCQVKNANRSREIFPAINANRRIPQAADRPGPAHRQADPISAAKA